MADVTDFNVSNSDFLCVSISLHAIVEGRESRDLIKSLKHNEQCTVGMNIVL